MPPMMITRESSIGEFDFDYAGERSRYHVFTAVYNSRDCYYFVADSVLSKLPTNRLGIRELADLGVYCEDWAVHVKNRHGRSFHKRLLRAARVVLTVDEVHSL